MKAEELSGVKGEDNSFVSVDLDLVGEMSRNGICDSPDVPEPKEVAAFILNYTILEQLTIFPLTVICLLTTWRFPPMHSMLLISNNLKP